MNMFLNDYNDLCHVKVLEKLMEHKDLADSGYGSDEHTKKAIELIRKDLKNDNVEIVFVAGGTIANILSVSANLMPYEGVIAASTGHISCHETGSIEATGHKVELIETKDGKLTKDLLENKIKILDGEHNIIPKVVYISHTTELGTLYTYEEVKAIYDVCLEYGMYLYIDGARMATGLAASDIEIDDLCEICDIFTLGGTKNGAMFGEAICIVSDDLKDFFRHFGKQRGAIMAKGFNLGLQYEALFEDGLYYELGKKSYESSVKLAESLKSIGVEFYQEPVSNQLFLILKDEYIEKLKENNAFEVMNELEDSKHVIRLVTTYRTTDEEIENITKDLKEICI